MAASRWRCAGRGRVDLTPQALLYGRSFLPMLVKRRKHVTFGLGRSALEGPAALARWSFDAQSPFERVRVLDPPPDMRLIDRTMSQFRAAYPAMRDLTVAQAWGGLIDWTPDAMPVISAVGKPAQGSIWPPVSAVSASDWVRAPGGWRLDLVGPMTRQSSTRPPFRHARLIDGTGVRLAKLQ